MRRPTWRNVNPQTPDFQEDPPKILDHEDTSCNLVAVRRMKNLHAIIAKGQDKVVIA